METAIVIATIILGTLGTTYLAGEALAMTQLPKGRDRRWKRLGWPPQN